MENKYKHKNLKRANKDNRLKIVTAVIFLLSFSLFLKLVNLQVMKYDLYFALASDQQQVYNKLEPERGKILIQDSRDLMGEKTYPIAINKDFAEVYAVPDNVEDPRGAAEKIYEIFDKERIAKEVADRINEEEKAESEDSVLNPLGSDDQARNEYKKIKIELSIEEEKKKIVDDYYKKLSKENDPFEPIKSKVSDSELEKIRNENIKGIDFLMEKFRYYPENNSGSQMIGFVGYEGDAKIGRYGLEGFFNAELSGKQGSIKAERSANGKLIIINDREYNQPVNGSDLILTINRSIQYFACKKLDEAALRHGADGGTIIIMDPKTGAIISMCSWPNYDPNNYNEVKNINIFNNQAIFGNYEPGSTFKVITMAAGLDMGKVKPETTYVDKGTIMIEGWPKPIKNSDFATHGGHGLTNMTQVLENSLNTGAIFVVQKVGADNYKEYVKKFGFGEKVGIEMETESEGDISSLNAKKVRPVEIATASFGQGITATPLQMAASFSAIANNGVLMKPYIVGAVVKPDGTREVTKPKQIRRVISERAALLLSGMMVNVVENGHSKRAQIDGYYIAGKTGTAQVADKTGGYSESNTIHSFIGFAPSEEPKFVMLVKLDDPKDALYAESTAVPLFKEVAEFTLNYYQVPKER